MSIYAPDPAEKYGETKAAKVPEVRGVLEQLDKEIYRLEEEVKGLAGQLAHVALPELPRPKDTSAAEKSQPHSDMFIHINNMRGRLAELNIFFSELKQRLEI